MRLLKALPSQVLKSSKASPECLTTVMVKIFLYNPCFSLQQFATTDYHPSTLHLREDLVFIFCLLLQASYRWLNCPSNPLFSRINSPSAPSHLLYITSASPFTSFTSTGLAPVLVTCTCGGAKPGTVLLAVSTGKKGALPSLKSMATSWLIQHSAWLTLTAARAYSNSRSICTGPYIAAHAELFPPSQMQDSSLAFAG